MKIISGVHAGDGSGCFAGRGGDLPERRGCSLSLLAVLVRRTLMTGAFYAISCVGMAQAEDYFNPALLSVGGLSPASSTVADLSRFEKGEQMPGRYRVDVYVNDQYVEARDVDFVPEGDGGALVPDLTLADYVSLGLKAEAVPALAGMRDGARLPVISQYIPAATTKLKFSAQRLDISIPQMMMVNRARGYVDPRSWDEGMPAALLDYMLTGNHTRYRGTSMSQETSDDIYANLRSGLNLGAWRLRNYSTWRRSSYAGQGKQTNFDVISTYLQRDIKAIRSQFTVGDASTPSEVFDSVQFRGVQLASDDSMLPDSLRGFAPVIRGVANSNAQVTIRQNGNIIYQSYVPPGPFEITDLYPSSLSGDLVVNIKENDGSERTFTQPYSSVAVMQREGQLKYSVTAGRLRNTGNEGRHKPVFVQGVLIYGLPHDVTVYGGLQVARNYAAGTGGVGMSLGSLGGISADVTHAAATLDGGKKTQGQSYRIRYSKSMLESGTTVTLAAYRYSTEGYYSFEDANTWRVDDSVYPGSRYRARSQFEVTLNQSLWDAGSMYLSGSQRDFWGREGTERTYSLGYSGSAYGISYGLNISQTRRADREKTEDRRIAMNVSVPLSRWLAGNDSTYQRNTMQANYGVNTDRQRNTTHQVGLSGTALEGSQLNYNLSQTTGNHGQGNSTSLTTTYKGRNGVLNGGFNRSETQEQFNYGVSGGVVAHPYGVTLSQPLGETIALVRAPGAGHVKVTNQTGISTDWRGYAVLPYLTPYRRTEVTLDPGGLGNRVSVDMTSASVVPTRGAVVLADYRTRQGRQALMTLMHQGRYVPFGAVVTLEARGSENENSAIVGDEGQVFLTGMPDAGMLQVKWGPEPSQQCHVPFRLPAARDEDSLVPAMLQGQCQ
ncbi:fimbrial biogenesis outer membrane usher protein [Salmonella enterica]|nr:fimbrial biogenesis outer membrane usher protein [Salmonella enterica]